MFSGAQVIQLTPDFIRVCGIHCFHPNDTHANKYLCMLVSQHVVTFNISSLRSTDSLPFELFVNTTEAVIVDV